MECKQCDWFADDRGDVSARTVNRRATAHFVETGHTVVSIGYDRGEPRY